MKVTSFHFMPYRDLPDDVEDRYRSVWVDAPWSELGDARKAGDYFNQSIDELMLAAEVGFDGLGTNEHHQNPYGFMCNPNLFGSILARLTRERGFDDVAIVQLGATLAATSPPIRIAEEYAVLDCLSGGRLIAGVPVGIGSDAGLSYGVTPIDQRARWREGIELMLKAWTSTENFAWNGEHYQLRNVNLWPRPIQEPHPPLLVPGAHSPSTWDMCHSRNWPYAFLSYFGAGAAEAAMDRFWDRAEVHGRDRNPYRASFLQLVAVADTDEEAEVLYGEHLEFFYKKLLHQPPQYFTPPGYVEYPAQVGAFRSMLASPPVDLKALSAKDMIERGFAVVGSPATVRDRLEAIARRLGIGHLMAIMQFGSMPHDLAERNIRQMGTEVLPHLKAVWDAEGWENHWWPLAASRPVDVVSQGDTTSGREATR
jgi:alkanesulfonate monooxygenase SsuD/methylene tetrahydromethanopterin reductase-like flavin-dependent oxidoreductase (luciferase family)